MLDRLLSTDFAPHLRQMFLVRLEGAEPVPLELVSVTELGPAARPGSRPPFALHFLGPASPRYLAQHIYPLEHDQLGALDLFLVPLGPESGRMRYEAIFT